MDRQNKVSQSLSSTQLLPLRRRRRHRSGLVRATGLVLVILKTSWSQEQVSLWLCSFLFPFLMKCLTDFFQRTCVSSPDKSWTVKRSTKDLQYTLRREALALQSGSTKKPSCILLFLTNPHTFFTKVILGSKQHSYMWAFTCSKSCLSLGWDF